MFSVVVPVYNHAKFLSQAVWSALRTPLVQEILLLDDGSSDGSAAIAASLAAEHSSRVRDLTPPDHANRGAHQRLNELVDAARCEWVAVLNSDDVFVCGRFETIVSDAHFPDADFVFGNVLFMDERGALTGLKRGPIDTWDAFRTRCKQDSDATLEERFLDPLSRENYLISTSNMVFRRTLHARVGGFAAYRYVHDWDFALRAMVLGRPLYVPHFLTGYRKHAGNTILENSQRTRREAKELFRRFAVDFPNITTRPEFQAGQKVLFRYLESAAAG